MTINNSLFDPITNSEDEMIKRAGINRIPAAFYLRAYIIARLLFFHELVISDSSVNLNRALRTLISADENKGIYDLRKELSDFKYLIENGNIKLAARDIYKDNFSESLRNAQNNKKRVDLPGKAYTELIDGICREENIYWWNAERVSQMFTQKIRDELKKECADYINIFLKDLSNRLSDQEILTYNMVKNEVLKKYNETSQEFITVRSMLREAYDYNVPEVLGMDYSRGFDISKRIDRKYFEVNPTEKYEFSWKYKMNVHALAALPADCLKYAWNSSQYRNYEEAMLQYVIGSIKFDKVLVCLTDYLDYIDRLLVEFYNRGIPGSAPKNIIARILEYRNPVRKTPEIVNTFLMAYDAKELIDDITINPKMGIFNFLMATVIPNLIIKGFEHHTALTRIDHAIIKL